MINYFRFCRRHVTDEKGASLVEYALLLGLIAIVCIGAITFLGQQPSTPISHVGSVIG